MTLTILVLQAVEGVRYSTG